jgi:hypothetical protein
VIGGRPGISTTIEPSRGGPGPAGSPTGGRSTGGGGGGGGMPLLMLIVMIDPGMV